MKHIPSNDEHSDGERLLRSSLQRALLKPAPESIALAVQARLATLPTPSPWMRVVMRYGGVVGVTVLLAAVIMVVVIGEPMSTTTVTTSIATPDRAFMHVLDVIASVPTAVSATTVCIVVFLLYGFVSTELSRR